VGPLNYYSSKREEGLFVSIDLERQPPLDFHGLSYLEEDTEVVVGRSDIDSYGMFPSDGAALLKQLEAGRTPAEAAGWYRETYGEAVDMAGFVETLRELKLIRDDAVGADLAEPAPVRWQRLGRALFSAPAWLAYAALVVAAVAVVLRDPRFMPDADHLFFVDYAVVVGIALFIGSIPLALFHESFHVLAGRRLGLRTKVRVSQRFFFLALETTLDGLVAVPRSKRYLPLLAGMLADILAIAGLTVVAYLTREPASDLSLLGGFCLALAFTTVMRFVWQFYFFLRTDVYYLVSTTLRCVDLQNTARELLRNRLNALLGRRHKLVDEDGWHPRDRQAARWYAPLLVVGYAGALVVLLSVVVPIAWEVVREAFRTVFIDGAPTSAHFWDSSAALALISLQLGAAGVVAWHARRRRRMA
jgi:hypothetical protein